MNIFDVANLAGVSKTTVSRVMAQSDKVSDNTRKKVLDAIATLGYTPNTSAQFLAGGKNKVIGVINDITISDPFYGGIDDLLATECRQRGYGIIYTVTNPQGAGCQQEISMMYGKVDGYIITGNDNDHVHSYKEDILRLTKMQQVPVIMLKSGICVEKALTIDIDNVMGGHQAASYLYNKGYRKIAYMHGGKNGSFYEGLIRERGFMGVMQEKNIDVSNHYYCDRSFATAYQHAVQVINDRPEVVFCETDLMAYGLIQGIQDLGYSVPQDIAVMGFDNVKFSNYEVRYNLTTVAQPVVAMARYAVEVLIDKIENDSCFDGSEMLIETSVHVGSTA